MEYILQVVITPSIQEREREREGEREREREREQASMRAHCPQVTLKLSKVLMEVILKVVGKLWNIFCINSQ